MGPPSNADTPSTSNSDDFVEAYTLSMTMFTSTFTEAHQEIVPIRSIDVDVMEDILNYAYSTKIQLTPSNVRPLLHGAHFLEAGDLVNLCKRYLKQHMSTETCLGVWDIAELYSWTLLEEEAKAYTFKRFANVCKGAEFLDLTADKLPLILKNDDLEVSDEKEVLDAVISWFYVDVNERKKDFGKVFQHVRLAHISPSYVHDSVEEDEVLWEISAVTKLVSTAKKYHALPHRRQEMQSSVSRRRNNAPQVETISVRTKQPSDANEANEEIQVHISENGKLFEPLPGTPPEGIHRDINAYNYKPWAFCEDFEELALYDCEGAWSTSTFTPKRKELGIGELDGTWYAIGGLLDSGVANVSVERLDLPANKWVAIAPLLVAVYKPAVISVSGKLYVLGGFSKPEEESTAVQSNVVQQYCVHTNTWTALESMPGTDGSLTDPRACALAGQIFICLRKDKKAASGSLLWLRDDFLKRRMEASENNADSQTIDQGGFVPTAEEVQMFKYDTKSKEWQRCANMNDEYVSGPVVLNARIFVLCKNANDDGVLACYNPVLDSWSDSRIFPHHEPVDILGPFLMHRDWENTSQDKALAGITKKTYADE